MDILGLIITTLSLGICVFYILCEAKEVLFLRHTIKSILNKSKIDSKQDLIKIKNYLNKNILYDTNLKLAKRPLFRHSASQILKSKYGFCGENARVSIKLLAHAGIRTRRIYLYGEQWGHVVIENQFNDAWFLFDGHYDPKTYLKDHEIAAILSKNINDYPNGYPENKYYDYCRVKIFYEIWPLKKLAKIKLPQFLVYFFESPYLIKAVFPLVFSILGVLIIFYS